MRQTDGKNKEIDYQTDIKKEKKGKKDWQRLRETDRKKQREIIKEERRCAVFLK